MDDRSFDDLTRILGSTETRRGALKMLGGGGLAALLARLSVGESEAACRKAKRPCKRDKQCCSGRCKNGRCKGNGEPAADFCVGKANTTPCGDGCTCILPTVSGAPFCGRVVSSAACFDDADCDDDTGPGSACFFNKFGEGQCAAPCRDPL